MKKTKVYFYLFAILIVLSLFSMIIFMSKIYSQTREINENIGEMSKYVHQIGRIGDEYNKLAENKKKEDVLNSENEQCKKEIKQIEQEIIDYQNKINSFK